MKPILLSSLLILYSFSSSFAQDNLSPEVEAFYQNALTKINVRHQSWVKSSAKEANQKNIFIDDIRNKAAAYKASQGLSESSLEFLIGLAGKLALGDQKEHIKQLQSALDSLKKQKDKLIDAIARLQDKRKPVTVILLDSLKHLSEKSKLLLTQVNSKKSEPSSVISRDTIRVSKTVSINQQVTQAAIDNQVFQLKKDIDSMSETRESISLRLQMAMDRYNKYMSTISNIYKKISDTSNAIIQNLK